MAHKLSLSARVDLDEIWQYLAQQSGSEAIADRQIDAITERFLLLAQWPRLGRDRGELRRGLRSLPVGNYIIFYRIERRTVAILRILHARRDTNRLMRSDPTLDEPTA